MAGEVDRLKLLHGPYAPPDARAGDVLICERRGREVRVEGWTAAPIPWPCSRLRPTPSPILCGDLARAVRTESELAVAHHWGVCVVTVWAWRKALGVGRTTAGTMRLNRDYKPHKLTDEAAAAGRRAALAPDAVARSAAARKGRPMHPNTAAALKEAAKRPRTDEHRRNLSEAIKARMADAAHNRTWTAAEDELLGTAPDAAVAARLGRSVGAVKRRRLGLGRPQKSPAR